MMSRKNIIALGFFFTTGCLVSFAQMSMKADQYGKWGSIVQSAQDILAGKTLDKGAATISPEAYLVIGKRYENLHSVINGEIKGCSLHEGASRQEAWLHLKVNDQENAAVLVLKTQTDKKTDDRFHTVVFMKDSAGHWSIQAWHASEGARAD